MRSVFITATLSILFLTVTATAREVTVRNAHSMAVESATGTVYLFGGADERQVFGDLWRLTGTRWEFITDDGPDPRTFAGLVFHEGRKSLILFGGEDALFGSEEDQPNSLSDTWEFANGRWNRLDAGTAPPARSAAAMAYDPLNDRIVMFGGYSQSDGKGERLSDTWQFRNGKWARLDVAGPSARVGAAVVFDPVRRAVLLFGGSTEDRAYGAGTGETWILEKNRWARLRTVQPPNIFNSAMAYMTERNEVIRFGGWNGSSRNNETWLLRDYGWIRIGTSQTPVSRNHSAMVFDPVNKRAVLFGGHDGVNVFGDLWFFASGKWTLAMERAPIERLDNGH